MEGTMLWFNPAKRHGFIHTGEGQRVRADQVEEARAVNVAAVPLFAARRARSRGGR
jgi:hypothetical protein